MSQRKNPDLEPRLAEAPSFLAALFEHQDLGGLVFGLFTLPRAASHWFDDPDEMAQCAIELSRGHDVYVRLTPLRDRPQGPRRGDALDAAALVCLYCEIDIGTAGTARARANRPTRRACGSCSVPPSRCTPPTSSTPAADGMCTGSSASPCSS